jgi:hypothetical protein
MRRTNDDGLEMDGEARERAVGNRVEAGGEGGRREWRDRGLRADRGEGREGEHDAGGEHEAGPTERRGGGWGGIE